MVKIAEIVGQNPWWSRGAAFVHYDQSLGKAEPVFFERREIGFEKGNMYLFRGPRQAGKTTYLKDAVRKLIEKGVPPGNILYLSLDFFTSRRELRNALNYFLDATRDAPMVFLLMDEITALEDWNLELKVLADQGITRRAAILATGSSAVRLKEKGELLPGRGLEGNAYYIRPLNFRAFALQSVDFIADHIVSDEFRGGLKQLESVLPDASLDFTSESEALKKEVQKVLPFKRELGYLFRIYLATGGLPGVINHYLSNRYVQRKETIAPQVSEIFIRDVLGDLSRLQRQETIARQLLGAIVERYTSRYSFSKLAREIERPHLTTIGYLEFLEESFISFVLYAYDFNKKKPKLKGDKKVYFFDPFIFHSVRSYLAGEEIWEVITKTLQDEELQSKVVEGLVLSHLLMYQEIPLLRMGKTFLWNYYDKNGKEIDAILKEKERYSAIEVKYRAGAGEQIKRIQPIQRYFILSKEDVGGKGKTMMVPVDSFLALLPSSERNV